MSDLPHIPGVLSADEAVATGEHLRSLQLDCGMIPWFPGGHCDPWNHVESAMALDVVGCHDAARRAYGWLADIQRPDGSWHNYYRSDGSVEETKLDTNVCAYLATGLYHHWRCSGDTEFITQMWPVLNRAMSWVLDHRRHDGTILWAVEPDERPWEYALLTGSSSIQHALRCGHRLGTALGDPRPDWIEAADTISEVIRSDPDAFEPKTRWAMDWYYPVLTGALLGDEAAERLESGWETFSMDGLGIRCVSDESWVTASETAECAIAHAGIGEIERATELLAWTRHHRLDDGSYLTGIVYPRRETFPADEHSSYTAAAVLLAADAISGTSPAAEIFHHL